jgi:hypothetical protein
MRKRWTQKKSQYLGSAIFLASVFAAGPGAQGHNELGAAEIRAGYDLLFNGSDLEDWHAYQSNVVTDAWTVRTTEPLGPRIEIGNGNKKPILTDKRFMNFDLKIDVKVPSGGEGGIFTRYEEDAPDFATRRSGPEFQICGPNTFDCAGPLYGFGSSYDMFPVRDSIRNTWYSSPESWNQIRIVAYDSSYVHYGNGKKLLEYKLGTPEFMAAYEASRYIVDGNEGRFYHIHPGGFLLQHHGTVGLAFRNVKAKELKIHPFLQEFPDGKWPEVLPQEFVFGKRGCADPSAANYDSTAEVSVPGRCHPLGMVSRDHSRAFPISIRYAGSGTTLVSIPFEHRDFRLMGLDGRAIQYLKTGEGSYSIPGNRTRGIAVMRLQAGGTAVSRLLIPDRIR